MILRVNSRKLAFHDYVLFDDLTGSKRCPHLFGGGFFLSDRVKILGKRFAYWY